MYWECSTILGTSDAAVIYAKSIHLVRDLAFNKWCVEFEFLLCMYGIPNSGFKEDNLNMYFTAQDDFSSFSRIMVSVRVCMYVRIVLIDVYVLQYSTVHSGVFFDDARVLYLRVDSYIHTLYLDILPRMTLFNPRILSIRPTRTCYSTHV